MTNLPVSGAFRVSATFGQTGSYWKNGHKGVDIVCDNRTVYATCDGRVRYIGFDADGWGRYVDIVDDGGYRHIFCHLSYDSVKVVVGERVDRSTVLGVMGTTGNSSGVHLHYQINNPNNIPINPCLHLGIPNEKGSYDSSDYQIKNGWVEENGGWRYYEQSVFPKKDEWVRDSVSWCYVASDGYCVKNAWKKDSVGWCYLDGSGRAQGGCWRNIDGRWYYFDDDCHAVHGMQTIGGNNYYFATSDYNGIKECQLIITDEQGRIK